MAVSEDRTTLPEINPLPPRRPSRRAMLIPKGRHVPWKPSPVLLEMRGPLPPEERRLLRTIARTADAIAQGQGSVFLLVELSPLDFDRLSAFEAGAEDLEETDQGGDDINGARQDQLSDVDGDMWLDTAEDR